MFKSIIKPWSQTFQGFFCITKTTATAFWVAVVFLFTIRPDELRLILIPLFKNSSAEEESRIYDPKGEKDRASDDGIRQRAARKIQKKKQRRDHHHRREI